MQAKASEQTGGMTWVLTSFSGFCTKNHFRTEDTVNYHQLKHALVPRCQGMHTGGEALTFRK
jgi:hypothetical protein